MRRVYIDSSALLAVLFGESSTSRINAVFRAHDVVTSTALIVAEVLAALAREGRPSGHADVLLRRVAITNPKSSLRSECEETLSHGNLRCADLAHIAAALEIAGSRQRKRLSFCSLDAPQRRVAAKLGFPVVP